MRVTVSSQGELHAFDLARQLARKGALERILTADPRVLLAPGIPLHCAWTFPLAEVVGRIPTLVPRLAPVASWDRLKARLHDRWAAAALGRPDLVVAWSGAARRVLIRARERGIPTVLERSGAHVATQDDILRQEAARFSQPGGVEPEHVRTELVEYALADRILVPSKFARGTFLERGLPPEKVLHVPYGGALSGFYPGKKEDNVFRIVFVGTIGFGKGIHYLLEAVRRLHLPRSELVMAGPIRREVEPVLQTYTGLFRATGPLAHAEVARLLRQGTVFVLPSLEEGLSRALQEALASGLPAIATPNSGAEEVMDNGREGFIVPPRDVDALCASIEKLFQDGDLRREMGRRAAARARRWTWDDYGDAVYTAFQGFVIGRGVG